MQVIHTGVMRGPNYWCPNRHKLFVLSVTLPEADVLKQEEVTRIVSEKDRMFPYAIRPQHFCNLVELTGQLVLELQSLVGLDCAYYKVHTTSDPNRFYLVYSYVEEVSGVYAGTLAVQIAEALKAGTPFQLEPELAELKRLYSNAQLGPSTRSIVEEAQRRGIPYRRLDRHSLIQLGYGSKQKTFRASVACTTSNLAVEQVSDKDGTKRILAANAIPVPKGMVITKKSSVAGCLMELDFPLVVKPLDGNHGKGITTYITSLAQLELAFDFAKPYSEAVIVEEHIQGSDYRFLLVNFKLVAVSKRLPARVIGDGRSDIQEGARDMKKNLPPSGWMNQPSPGLPHWDITLRMCCQQDR